MRDDLNLRIRLNTKLLKVKTQSRTFCWMELDKETDPLRLRLEVIPAQVPGPEDRLQSKIYKFHWFHHLRSALGIPFIICLVAGISGLSRRGSSSKQTIFIQKWGITTSLEKQAIKILPILATDVSYLC